MSTCPKCGAPRNSNARVCGNCGNPYPAEKEGFSVASVIGFVLSFLPFAILVAIFAVAVIKTSSANADDETPIGWIATIIQIVCCISGFVVSIIGVKNARKKNQSGSGFGVAGIVLASVTAGFMLISGLFVGCAALVSKGISSSNTYRGNKVVYDDYEVSLDSSKTEAAVTVWFWDGDPENNVITIPEKTPDGALVTAIGGESEYLAPEMKIKFTDGSKDFFQSKAFVESENYKSYMEDYNEIPNENSDLTLFGIEPGTKVYFETVEFVIKVPAKVRAVHVQLGKDRGYGKINDDGSITFYKCYVRFEVDPDNKQFVNDENGHLLYAQNHMAPLNAWPYRK